VREFHPGEEYDDLAVVTDDEDDEDEVVTVEAAVKQEVPVLEGYNEKATYTLTIEESKVAKESK
jgi:hypothetical protein